MKLIGFKNKNKIGNNGYEYKRVFYLFFIPIFEIVDKKWNRDLDMWK